MTRNSLRLKFLNDSRVAGFNDLSELAAGSDLSELSELSIRVSSGVASGG